MKPLKDYVKNAETLVTTSVTITPAQADFVRQRNMNLSAFVRDKLQDFINEAGMPQKKGGVK